METIYKDKRQIKKIYWPDESQLTVGENGVEKIIPYKEQGSMEYVTWLAIYRNGAIDQRVNTTYLDCVVYS